MNQNLVHNWIILLYIYWRCSVFIFDFFWYDNTLYNPHKELSDMCFYQNFLSFIYILMYIYIYIYFRKCKCIYIYKIQNILWKLSGMQKYILIWERERSWKIHIYECMLYFIYVYVICTSSYMWVERVKHKIRKTNK